ncbi:MAG: hypothetical protein IPG51_17510 [Chloroflexi bacterium]|nr:hypothetical protein [Chloroflexota bacterium]
MTLPLGLYSDEEAHTLFLARLKNTDITFKPALTAYLRFLVDPHPFSCMSPGITPTRRCCKTRLEKPDDFSQLNDPIEMEADSHLSYLWQNLTAEEQYVLAIADGPIDSLRLLEQQCLLINTDGKYTYANEILRRYVRRQEVRGLIQAGPFVIDQQRHRVWADGRK